MRINHELIEAFINAIFPLPDEFGLVESDDNSEPLDYDALSAQINRIDNEAYIEFGMSKMVICSPNLYGFVIKIPFNGWFDCSEDTNYKLSFTPFSCGGGINSDDYCSTEYETYLALKEFGLECFVAKTILYDEIGCHRIYIQEEICPLNIFETNKITPSYRSKVLASKMTLKERLPMRDDWLAQCIDVYGYGTVKAFLSYCKEKGEMILQDMHGGNYGYRHDKSPAILDFSGYDC